MITNALICNYTRMGNRFEIQENIIEYKWGSIVSKGQFRLFNAQ